MRNFRELSEKRNDISIEIFKKTGLWVNTHKVFNEIEVKKDKKDIIIKFISKINPRRDPEFKQPFEVARFKNAKYSYYDLFCKITPNEEIMRLISKFNQLNSEMIEFVEEKTKAIMNYIDINLKKSEKENYKHYVTNIMLYTYLNKLTQGVVQKTYNPGKGYNPNWHSDEYLKRTIAEEYLIAGYDKEIDYEYECVPDKYGNSTTFITGKPKCELYFIEGFLKKVEELYIKQEKHKCCNTRARIIQSIAYEAICELVPELLEDEYNHFLAELICSKLNKKYKSDIYDFHNCKRFVNMNELEIKILDSL